MQQVKGNQGVTGARKEKCVAEKDRASELDCRTGPEEKARRERNSEALRKGDNRRCTMGHVWGTFTDNPVKWGEEGEGKGQSREQVECIICL